MYVYKYDSHLYELNPLLMTRRGLLRALDSANHIVFIKLNVQGNS